MEPNVVLHTAARRYLIDRRRDWIEAYERLPNQGRAEDGYHYREDAKDVFPRYNVLDAIRVEVERLDPEELPPVQQLVDALVHAGYNADDLFTTGEAGDVEGRAIDDERARFVEWVKQITLRLPDSVLPLAYRRTLTSEESLRWRTEVERRWPIEHGGWWEPINSKARDEALALDGDAFCAGDEDGPATLAVRRALGELGVRRAVELREYGPDFEVAVDDLSPVYNGAEGIFTSDGARWLLFASHEGATAVGGTLVEPLKRVWPSWADALWTGWD
ncbi:MAG TPA: hypothetical protein VM938_14880 [Acidimicrobiales bacterium]|nr:hypothetical protein [Acidimicrobiales bacterium]